ncbi:DUF6233 domain-containing protein [Streptomyces sp. NPDC090306]|uniref:DUF6233 domain-containing protein n=1 Tax=Streptomyces sp. NPDC090306 TaxID=3365961 RepID=UPI00381A9ACD
MADSRPRRRHGMNAGRPAAGPPLPPDPARLRALLAYIDRQVAETDTIGTWLRLQRDAVQRALASADRPQRQERPPARRTAPAGHSYLLESKRGPNDSLPPAVHRADCTMNSRPTSPLTEQDARMALTPGVGAEPCEFCRPETALGLLD